MTGKASHIFSASPAGPRGQGKLTEDQLRSVENAIWLCSDHATLIDTNRGEKFPPAVLVSFKSFQEARVARDQGGVHSPIGWYHELMIKQGPVFAPGQKLRFGKVTLVEGMNASGKTALCDWLSGLGTPSAMWRWDHPTKNEDKLNVCVTYFDPEEQHVSIRVLDGGVITYALNGRTVPYFPLRLGIVRFDQDGISSRHTETDSRDEVEKVAQILGVAPQTIRNLVPLVNGGGEGCVQNLRVEVEDGVKRLYANYPFENDAICFSRTSAGERAMVLIELSAAMARFSSEFMPTILLIDGGAATLDDEYFARYAEFLASPEHHFQSIVTQVPRASGNHLQRWAGWEFVSLIGKEHNVTIDQSPF